MDGLASLLDSVALGPAGFFARYVLAGVAFALAAAAARRLPAAARAPALVVASVALIAALTTALTALVLVVGLVLLHAVVERLPPGPLRSAVAPMTVAALAVTPIFLLPMLPAYQGRAREFTAFATNLLFLRTWGYAYDRLRRPEPIGPSLPDFLLHQLFLPSFANGPLVSHTEFARRRLKSFWEPGVAGAPTDPAATRGALVRIARGVALGAAAAFLVHAPGNPDFRAAIDQGGFVAWSLAARVYAWWYVSFVAWVDVAIGLGRLSGVELPENFDNPSVSYGPADFWRRWNMTLMRWLRSYVYLPLGGALLRGRDGQRHLEWRNTFAVFVFVAAYHLLGGVKLLGLAAWAWEDCFPWFFWGVLNATAVLATRAWKRPARLGAGHWVVAGATLAFACVGHMTAMLPPGVTIADVARLYRGLLGLP